tara:strand:- start:352 stop:495 length:144 start_codon:yes stop_codon:yes gene_type:complete
LAESEEAIHEALDVQGLNEIIVTSANEMTRYISVLDIQDQAVGDPDL